MLKLVMSTGDFNHQVIVRPNSPCEKTLLGGYIDLVKFLRALKYTAETTKNL